MLPETLVRIEKCENSLGVFGCSAPLTRPPTGATAPVAHQEASALTGIGLTSIREAISSGDLKAKKHGRRTIILPDDLRVWLKTLPDARKPIEESPA